MQPRRLFYLGVAALIYFCAARVNANHLFYRPANTTLNRPAEPQAGAFTYFIQETMNGLVFDKPVGFATEPGETNRLFVVERTGRLVVITNLANPVRTVFMAITNKVYSDYEFGYVEGLSSLAFHPGYATNGFFYVTYTFRTNAPGGGQNFNRLSRFQRHSTDRNVGMASSEVVLIQQLDEGDGHNINDLHFGPDGYLYVAIGDEGDGRTGGDEFHNAQRIDKDFFAGILRIDVDKKPGSLPTNPHPAATSHYAIPSDNPYVGVTSFNGSPVNPNSVRTEFYAVGFRNVWRMSFDPSTGHLYAGDVGAYEREEINVVQKGGNYGWAYRQGDLVGPKGTGPGGINFISPIAEIRHGYATNQGNAIIGGRVYRGTRFPELVGAYVFSDYVSGNVWMLRYDGTSATPFHRIASKGQVGGFGVDPRNGDLLLADQAGGSIFKLDRSTSGEGNIPGTLAETGIFSNVGLLQPHTGVVPYELNVPFWSDNAKKRRWFSIPDVNLKMGFSRDGNWTFPASTVWVKHFDLELTKGVPSSARRIETRVLVKNEAGIYGVTYRWGNSTTNATLVPEGGMDESFVINDGGTNRTQVWRYPSRNECMSCHTPAAGYALGFNTAQLNRDFDYGIVTNQIFAYSDAGYFTSLVTNRQTLRALAHATNSAYSREYRVRSYLAANCAQCHQPGGTGGGFWDARISSALSTANIIDGNLANYHGNAGNRVVVPGNTNLSMLHSRISSLGSLRMPPVGSSVLDREAMELIRQWIVNDLAGYQTFSAWQTNHFGSSTSAEAASQADPDSDRTSNYLEYLLGGNPKNGTDGWKPSIAVSNGLADISFLQISNRIFEVQAATNLLPPVLWHPVDLLANRPVAAQSNRTNQIRQTITNSNQFFRVRVSEP